MRAGTNPNGKEKTMVLPIINAVLVRSEADGQKDRTSVPVNQSAELAEVAKGWSDQKPPPPSAREQVPGPERQSVRFDLD